VRVLYFIAAVLFLVSPASAQEREIVFHRDVKVGQKFEFDGSLKEEKYQKIEATGALLKDSSTKLEGVVKGLIEVTGVTSHGMANQVRLVVKEWLLKVEGQALAEIKPGDVITGEGGKPPVFKINGVKLSMDETRVLGGLLALKADDEPDTDNSVLGPGHKVKPGDSWSINAEAQAKDLKDAFHAEITPAMVKGIVKFNGETVRAGEPCQKIEAHITLNGAGLDIPGAPPGTKAKTFVVSVDVKTELPADVTKQARALEDETSSEILGESEVNRDGATVLVRFDLGSRVAKRWVMDPVK
jgi:hypothetical protein